MAGRLKIYNNATSTWEYIGGYGKTMPAGDVVGTSDTQTLTNKTLTSPIISGAGGTTAGQQGFDATDHALLVGDGTNNASIYVYHWKAFTPSWTNLTVGAGTNTGYYCQIGKTILVTVTFTLAADSSVGTAPYFTLPVTAASGSSTARKPFGQGMAYDSGGDIYFISLNFDATAPTTRGVLRALASDATYVKTGNVTATIPFTFGTGDILSAQGTYEAA